jgi:hypothetical protein
LATAYQKENIMKTTLFSVVVAAGMFGSAAVSLAQTIVVPAAPVVTVPRVTYYAPAAPVVAPRVTYYAPAAATTTYYAPAPAVTTYYAPATVAPTVVASPVVVSSPVMAPAGYVIPPPRFRLRRVAPVLYVAP